MWSTVEPPCQWILYWLAIKHQLVWPSFVEQQKVASCFIRSGSIFFNVLHFVSRGLLFKRQNRRIEQHSNAICPRCYTFGENKTGFRRSTKSHGFLGVSNLEFVPWAILIVSCKILNWSAEVKLRLYARKKSGSDFIIFPRRDWAAAWWKRRTTWQPGKEHKNNTDVYYPERGTLELQSDNKARAVIFFFS